MGERNVSLWSVIFITEPHVWRLWWLVGNITFSTNEAHKSLPSPWSGPWRNPGTDVCENDTIYKVGWYQRGLPDSHLANSFSYWTPFLLPSCPVRSICMCNFYLFPNHHSLMGKSWIGVSKKGTCVLGFSIPNVLVW